MTIIIFNVPGILISVIAIGTALGIGHMVGISGEGPLMVIAGPLCVVMDLIYRSTRSERGWFHPGCGGALFFIPMWVLGIIWLILGVVYISQGRG